MSDTETPITGTTETPLPNGADTSASAPEAAPKEGADEFLPDTATESKADATKDAKAEDGKTEAKPEGEDKDFLAETDDDDAESEADAQSDAKQDGESKAYQPFTLPENISMDDAALAQASDVFRKQGRSQEEAQELVSLHADLAAKTVQAYHQTLADAHANTLKQWAKDTKAHPEFGGEHLKTSKADAARVLALEPGARKALVEYGLDRHPAVFALLARVGSKLSDDSLVRDDAGAPEKTTPVRDADMFFS